MEKIIELINKSKKIAVLTHISEDADALGSAAAFGLAMKSLGKIADIYISEKIPERLMFIGHEFLLYEDGADTLGHDLCVCLDCGDLKRIEDRKKIFETAGNTISIDHHYTNTYYADENLVFSDYSSTGEVLYDLFCKMNLEITREIARLLYIAIASDTGGFKYSCTSPQTMRTAARLMETGFDYAEICRLLFDTEARNILRLKGYIMENIHEYCDGKLCIAKVDDEILKRYGAEEKDAGDIVNIPRKISGCEIAAAIRESGEKTKVSLRSNGFYDVSAVAGLFGGGGHRMAAGITMENIDIESAEKAIVEACEKLMREQKR